MAKAEGKGGPISLMGVYESQEFSGVLNGFKMFDYRLTQLALILTLKDSPHLAVAVVPTYPYVLLFGQLYFLQIRVKLVVRF